MGIIVYTNQYTLDVPYLMPVKKVLAKASNSVSIATEQMAHKVVVITNGTTPLGTLLCKQAALAGASVYALDSAPEALARQAISFRQNKLRLRGIPCDINDDASMQKAIQEIVNHAPPVDHWIHAGAINLTDATSINQSTSAIKAHFELRGKGCLTLITTTIDLKEKDLLAPFNNYIQKGIAVHLVHQSRPISEDSAAQIVRFSSSSPEIFMHSF